jgi:hypothetical protein
MYPGASICRLTRGHRLSHLTNPNPNATMPQSKQERGEGGRGDEEEEEQPRRRVRRHGGAATQSPRMCRRTAQKPSRGPLRGRAARSLAGASMGAAAPLVLRRLLVGATARWGVPP